MAWNSQGGGPWGGGGSNNPWGRGPGGVQPPDIEDLLRKGQDRLRRALPGGFGSMRGLAVILAVLVVLWGATGIYRVQTEEQGVVMRFGEWVATTPPGLHYTWPAPIGRVLKPKVTRINRIELGFRSVGDARVRPTTGRSMGEDSLMLTGDENIVDINFTLFWKIKDAGKYLFNVRNPEATIKVAAESAMREIIGQTQIQQALTEGRNQIEVKTRALLQQMLDEYGAGIDITQVQVLKADPPGAVVDAFNDVQRAKADRERLRNEAEAYRNDVIPRARGEAEKLVQEAQAYREQVTNIAEGDAKRFISVYQVYKQAPDVTAKRMYLETIEEVLQNSHKVIIDRQSGGSVVPFFPMQDLLKKGGAAPAQGGAR